MNALLVSLFLVAVPAAQDASECSTLADMMLMARAMAEENVSNKQIRGVLARAYDGARSLDWIEVVVPHAQNSVRSAEDEAIAILDHCLKNRGNVHKFFGDAV